MDEAEKITGIYERKLIRRLLQTDAETNAIHRRFINAMAPVLAKYRALKNGIIIHDPDLQKQIEGQLAIFSKQLKDSILNAQGDAWKLSNEKTDEIFRSYIDKMPQSGKYIYNKKWNAEKNKFDYTKTEKKQIDFFSRNIEAFEQFQKRKYEGMGLSERVWKLADGNKEMLETYIENGLSVGRSANQIAQDVQQLLEKPDKLFRRVRNKKTGKLELSPKAKKYNAERGISRSSFQNAKRLARTETNMAYRSADQERWNRQKFVIGYEVHLSPQHPKRDICNAAAGKYPKEFRFVGWHPNCFCYAVPILLPLEDRISYLKGNRVKYKPITDIPDTMKTYIADNTEKISGWKNQPFWVRDNFKEGRIENGIDLFGQSKTAAIKNAKSVKEAKEIARSLGTVPVYKIEKNELPLANFVNSWMDDIKGKGYGVPPNIAITKSLFTGDYEDAPALFNPKLNVIGINPKFSVEQIELDAITNNNIGWWTTGDATHSLNHEYGHYLQRKYNAVKADNPIHFNDGEKKLIMKIVSGYAADNSNEFVAEIFAGLIHGLKYEDFIIDLFEKYGGIRP